jgi:aminoglycoside/choline kinase family phosphotransferase
MGERVLSPAELTRWLAPRLGGANVVGVRNEPVGTGQMSESRRLTLEYSQPSGLPSTMIAKFESASEASRAASRATRTYEVETAFYRDIRDRVSVNAPTCFYNHFDADRDEFALLLSDFSPCTQGNQLTGCTTEEASAAVREIAKLHGPLWGNDDLKTLSWLHRNPPEKKRNVEILFGQLVPGFVDRYASRLDEVAREVVERLAREPKDYFTNDPARFAVIHGDYRLDNILFMAGSAGVSVGVVDFQTAAVGCPLLDVAYFIGAGLVPMVRREAEERLLGNYLVELGHFAVSLSHDEAWALYRRYTFAGFVMAVVASMIVKQTDRGDEMFMAMANRHAQHVVDLDAFSVLAD